MRIKALETVVYHDKRYTVGEEYEVDAQVGYDLATSVEIIEQKQPKARVQSKKTQPKMQVKRSVMTRKQVRTKRK